VNHRVIVTDDTDNLGPRRFLPGIWKSPTMTRSTCGERWPAMQSTG